MFSHVAGSGLWPAGLPDVDVEEVGEAELDAAVIRMVGGSVM
ncbi:hypothetical protein [Kitasatospora sp. NPDC056273]